MQSTSIDVARLHSPHHTFTLLGRVQRNQLRWAGQFVCTVQTSVGVLQVTGNRDVMLGIKEASWLALRMQRAQQGVHVASWTLSSPLVHAAWLPSVPCAQPATLQRLRLLLGRLPPVAQAIFMAVMARGHTQRRFFNRAAALDHHCVPGGVFEQSVRAAELAYAAWHPSEAERDAASLGALLFDFGKLFDPLIGHDLPREGPELEPHVMTRSHVRPACDLMERCDGFLACTVGGLLIPGFDKVNDPLYQRVRHAVETSWLTPSPAESGAQ